MQRTFVDDPNPWLPEANLQTVMVIGKLGEECSECATSIFRCLIQGVEGREPSTGEINKAWLQNEIADVLANAFLVIEHLDLDIRAIHERRQIKTDHLRKWHAMELGADGRLKTEQG